MSLRKKFSNENTFENEHLSTFFSSKFEHSVDISIIRVS